MFGNAVVAAYCALSVVSVQLPVLELKFDDAKGEVSYRWKVDEKDFAMPIRVGARDNWQVITPTTEWETMKSPLSKDKFEVATDLYYVAVKKS